MNPTVSIPQLHPTKGLTCHRSEKMAWATTLLQDPDTLSAYGEYARESAYEVDESYPRQASPTQPTSDMHNPEPPPGGHRRIRRGLGDHHKNHHIHNREPVTWTSTKTPKSKIPPRIPLCRIIHHNHMQGSSLAAVPLASVHTKNFYIPLYTDSKETSHDHTSAHIVK